MTDRTAGGVLAGPGAMLFSAALFGYFGFMLSFPETDVNTGKLIPLVVTLKWTLRGAAIVFLTSALVVMVRHGAGELLYALGGLAAAGTFLVIALWDLNSTYYSGVHPFLLFVFAAWNGYGSWTSLRTILAMRAPGPELDPDRF